MTTLRNVAGSLMLMSSVTHLSEIYAFGWGSPVMAAVVGFGLAFLVIGWHLAVDLTVFPICAYLLVQHRSQGRE